MQSISSRQTIVSRAQLWSAWLGNLFEHYDTALFSFLSPCLAPLMFPNQIPIIALILTYGMIPLGMLVRPIGSLFFGYIGDFYGRKVALFWSLIGMSIVSAGIAFCPTFEQAGMLAPCLFAIGRLLQNFFAAGEIVGGGVFLLENAPEKKHDWLSGIYNASTIGGILLASAGVSVLYATGFHASAWRGLYLLGAVTGLFACFIRTRIPDVLANVSFSVVKGDWLRSLWLYRWPFLQIVFASGFSYATYSMALVVINGFLPLVSFVPESQISYLNTTLLVLDFFALPLFGLLACRIPREKLMLGAALGCAIFGIPLFWGLQGASWERIVFIRACLVLLGVAFSAPFYAWVQSLIPPHSRYTIISFGYAIGSQLLGSPTSSLTLWLFHKTGSVAGAALYWVIFAVCCSICLILSRSRSPKVVDV